MCLARKFIGSYMILDSHPDHSLPGLKAIGYWAHKDIPDVVAKLDKPLRAWGILKGTKHLPWPHNYIGEWENAYIKANVIEYVLNAPAIIHWLGTSCCRFECPHQSDKVWAKNQIMDLGSTCLSDGIYVWPEGFHHYLDVHNVIPPKEFLDHVLSQPEDFLQRNYQKIKDRFGDGV